MRSPKRPVKGIKLRQVLQVVPFCAVTVGSQVFVVNEVYRSTHAILAVFRPDAGLKRRLAEANQVGNEGARKIPVVADTRPLFFVHSHQFDMGACFVVTNSDDAKSFMSLACESWRNATEGYIGAVRAFQWKSGEISKIIKLGIRVWKLTSVGLAVRINLRRFSTWCGVFQKFRSIWHTQRTCS